MQYFFLTLSVKVKVTDIDSFLESAVGPIMSAGKHNATFHKKEHCTYGVGSVMIKWEKSRRE